VGVVASCVSGGKRRVTRVGQVPFFSARLRSASSGAWLRLSRARSVDQRATVRNATSNHNDSTVAVESSRS
jgi:hypothetical protein